MKNLTLSALGRKARDGFCHSGSGASSSGVSSSSFSGSFDLAAARQASVNKLARLLGEEVKSDDKVLFDHCSVSRGRRNAFANIFRGLPSGGLRRLFAVYGIDEVQTKAPPPSESLDLEEEEARRERQMVRQLREWRIEHQHQEKCQHQHQHQHKHQHQNQHQDQHQHQHQHQHQQRHRARSAMDPSGRHPLPACAADRTGPQASVACGINETRVMQQHCCHN